MKAILLESLIPENDNRIQKILNQSDIIAFLEFVSQHRFNELTLSENLSYILECLAPMLLSQKPAELLNIGLHKVVWREFRVKLTQIPDIEVFEVRKINQRQQILFYNKKVLARRLINPISQEFLQQINYPPSSSLEDYLEKLIEKIRFRNFPHEVGLFLGYPLKDVLGFMGLAPLPFVKTQGWRVYGDEKLSDDWYEKYQLARRLMNKAIFERQLAK